jgi:hypothetical protein
LPFVSTKINPRFLFFRLFQRRALAGGLSLYRVRAKAVLTSTANGSAVALGLAKEYDSNRSGRRRLPRKGILSLLDFLGSE